MASLLNRSLGDIKKLREVGSQSNQKPIFGKNRINETGDSWKHDLFDAQPIKESIVIDEARSPALLITNLHYDVSEAELEALFGQIGKIDRGPVIKFDQSGRATEGLAFISYHSESHAADAIKAFNGASAKGQPIGLRYEFGMPLWVCSSLGLVPNRAAGSLPNKASGLLGRIHQDRTIKKVMPSPYENDRFKSSRSSFPPTGPRGSGVRNFGSSRGSRDHHQHGHGHGHGPIRSFNGPPHRGREMRGGGIDRGRGGGRSGMKSAKDLDKELEAFMDTTPQSNSKNTESKHSGDVQMSE